MLFNAAVTSLLALCSKQTPPPVHNRALTRTFFTVASLVASAPIALAIDEVAAREAAPLAEPQCGIYRPCTREAAPKPEAVPQCGIYRPCIREALPEPM